MSIEYIISQLVNGLRLGSVYAIVAVGYSIVYGILRLINFAHGDIMTIGVYIMLLFMTNTGMPLWAIVLISVAASVVVECSSNGWPTGPCAARGRRPR